jgi:hypothetical protein
VVGGLITREEAMDSVLDAEFTETRSMIAAPPAVAERAHQLAAPAAPEQPVKRGPGRPPKVRPEPRPEVRAEPIDLPSKAAAELGARYGERIDSSPAPAPDPELPPSVLDHEFEAPRSDNGFADPPSDASTAPDFHSWLASCRTVADLEQGRDRWVRFSKEQYKPGSPEVLAMQAAYNQRLAVLRGGSR